VTTGRGPKDDIHSAHLHISTGSVDSLNSVEVRSAEQLELDQELDAEVLDSEQLELDQPYDVELDQPYDVVDSSEVCSKQSTYSSWTLPRKSKFHAHGMFITIDHLSFGNTGFNF